MTSSLPLKQTSLMSAGNNHPARAASLPREAPQGVQPHEPDRPTGVEFHFEQVGGAQVLPLLETKRGVHRS